MRHIAVRNPPRADASVAAAIGDCGVATIHEAQGRTGLLAPYMRPIHRDCRASGPAVTIRVPPGDNWMIHVAVELCRAGDVVVVSPTVPCDAGYVGELLATAMRARGVGGLVIDAGCRDVSALREMGFPVWSKCVSAAGTVKATLGSVNIPIVCAGQLVAPGDVVAADEDGVVVVERLRAAEVLEAARAHLDREAVARKRYASGELSLDVHGMREPLAQEGLMYVDAPAEA